MDRLKALAPSRGAGSSQYPEDVHAYLDFYSLSQAPFRITPDPQFLFLSSSHKTVLGTIAYGIASRQGFVAVFGEAGVGKTTLLRAYLTQVNRQELQTIFVGNADLAFDDLLRLILRELGHTASTHDTRAIAQQLQQALAEEAHQSRTVVLIIDAAQAMPVETLAQLPRLSALEGATGETLQLVLVGQPELHSLLAQDALRHLAERIAIRATILPLTRQESLAYIHHRLAQVMQGNQPIFTTAALRRIVRHAQGSPRALNTFCTNALIAGFAARQKPITAALVQRVSAAGRARRRMPVWPLGLAASVALALLGTLLSLAPWQARHDAPLMPPRATLPQDGDGTAEEVRETPASAVPVQGPEGETNRAAQEAQSPALTTQQSEAADAASAQQPAATTQAMQELLPWPGTARRTHEEHLDTQAMDKLLTSLESADRAPLPTAPRSKAGRRKETRRLPRVSSASRRMPGFAVSPQRSDSAWPGPSSASRSAPAWPDPWSAPRLFTPEPSDSTE